MARSKKKQSNDDLGRNWTFIVYPDSCDPEYAKIINNQFCEWCESPLHDQDIDEEGKPKKPHRHIVLHFEGNKTHKQIKALAKKCKAVIAPLHGANGESCKVSSIRGMVRYLTHVDYPDKHQYDKSGIISHNGMDIEDYFKYAAEMTKRFISEMMQFCDEFNILEYADLLNFAMLNRYDTWFDLLTVGRQSFTLIKFIDSRRHSIKEINNACN